MVIEQETGSNTNVAVKPVEAIENGERDKLVQFDKTADDANAQNYFPNVSAIS